MHINAGGTIRKSRNPSLLCFPVSHTAVILEKNYEKKGAYHAEVNVLERRTRRLFTYSLS